MTVDDSRSIYVGGLSYNASEHSLRRVFHIYGAIVQVKIIKEQTVGGKRYGFVTFKNPRSAMHAIAEMDGRSIEGRLVRVNQVNSRPVRSNFRNRSGERPPLRSSSRELVHHSNRGRPTELSRDRGFTRLRHPEEFPRHDSQNNNTTKNHNAAHQTPNSPHGFSRDIHSEREFSSKSSDHHHQGERKLEIASQKVEEIQQEITSMEETAELKKNSILKLQEKAQMLEDAVTAARKLRFHRQTQLSELLKCYGQVKEYNERLKNSEQDLQNLVDSTKLGDEL